MPFCCPFRVLQNYTYKIKVIPGGMKRGKMIDSIKNSFKKVKTKDEVLESIKKLDYDTVIPAHSKIVISNR